MKLPRYQLRYIAVLTIICTPLLGGCVAAALPLLSYGAIAWNGAKYYTLSSGGGSVGLNIDDSKVTDAQKEKVKSIKNLAVWPDGSSASVFLAESLSEGGRFNVVSPSRVSATLGKQMPANLKMMTGNEIKEMFSKVCQETKAEAIISLRETGQETNGSSYFSLDRPNMIQKFVTQIYRKDVNGYVVEIPVEVKVELGGKNSSGDEATRLVYSEVAKKIVAMAQ